MSFENAELPRPKIESKHTLVLVHGFLGSGLNWGPVVSKLKSNPELSLWNFLTVDLLGHAYRPINPEKKSISLAEMTEDLLLQLNFSGPFVALGHSFGLRPLLNLVSSDPSRISTLIVEDSSPVVRPSSLEFLKSIFENSPVPFSTRNEAKKYFDTKYGLSSPISRFLLSNIRQNSEGLHTWRFASEPLKNLLIDTAVRNQWNEWESFEGAIHLIRGEKSDFLTKDLAEEAISRRGNKPTHFYQIAQSGHWIHSEKLEEFTKVLTKILLSLE